jgi:hypothetical protein
MAAAGPLVGGVFGAAGNIAGGLLGQVDDVDLRMANFDPVLNPALQGATTDALSMIGRGDIFSEPSPMDQLVGRIQGLPKTNKFKTQALTAIQEITSAGGFDDPLGTKGPGGSGQTNLIRGSAALNGLLAQLGITENEFRDTLERDKEFKAKQKRLSTELSGLNENSIRNRATTANTANQLLADAAGFATTGQPQTGLQSDLLNRVNRGIDDQEEQFLLKAGFGGFQPGAGLEGFGNQRTDAPLTAIEQALAAAAGLTSGLGGGLEFAQKAADQQINAGLGAASIASQQANAANQLRQQADLSNAEALANGVSGAASSFGGGLGTSIGGGLFGGGGTTTTSNPLGGGSLTPTIDAANGDNFRPFQFNNTPLTTQTGP